MPKFIIYTDGGARGNPGPAGIGIVIISDKRKMVSKISEYIGKATNNQAEYKALLRALSEAKNLHADEVEIFMDSELAVKQLNQEYKIKDKNLGPLFIKAWNLLHDFKKYSIKHIPRTQNKKADELVNLAIDKADTQG